MKLNFLKNMAVRLELKKDAVFSYPVEKQKKYLNNLKEPKNNFERSYNQYCCQMKLNGKIITILLNFMSIPILIYFLIKKGNSIEEKESCEAIFISEGISDNVIPDELKREFKTWSVVNNSGESFTEEDKKYFRNLAKKYPLSWHFLLKNLIKIRLYSYIIQVYQPEIIVVCSEYSFTSSLLTDYCHYKSIDHINVMHGEKLYYMRDSFFKFDRCYVWSVEYIKLFKSLRADKNQFITAIPRSLLFEKKYQNIEKKVDYTYYLGAENEETLDCIFNCMDLLVQQGNIVRLRPHPRYSNLKKIYGEQHLFEIEEIEKIPIEQSVMATKNAVSLYSTVLRQAYYNGINVIIDDISNTFYYNKLIELNYVLLKKSHQLLSMILKVNKE